MEVFNHLVALHFHHDCTDHLLGLITQQNNSTLKILDISFSQNVSDSSAKSIVKCQSLTELDIIGTSLSVQVSNFIRFFYTICELLCICKEYTRIRLMNQA